MVMGLELPFLTSIKIGPTGVGGSLVLAIICGVIASSKGRNALVWGVLGYLFSCLTLIVLLCMSDLEDEDEIDQEDEIERLDRQTRRLKESLKKERLRNASFQSGVLGRLDAHDMATGLDTRDIKAPLELPATYALPSEQPSWYYDDGGHPAGPISRNALLGLRAAGNLSPESLVWREGFADWLPMGEVDDLQS
ncbi:MAG: DUF4339 domain-containing protein [Planctomycetes bacterium]|nr:DUF4339 domain-containing protein [Planctomycetota bacterium]